MFGWLKERWVFSRGYRRGRDFRRAVDAEIDAHIAGRVLPAAARVVDAFRGLLRNVFDDPQDDPRAKAVAYWKVFEENLSEFANRMKAELSAKIYGKWDDNFKEDDIFAAKGGMREATDRYISAKVDDIVSEMRLKAVELMPSVLEEIERREAAAAQGSTS
jgi:hypothetical protein